MDAKVALGFMSLLDRLSHSLDSACEALESRLDRFEA